MKGGSAGKGTAAASVAWVIARPIYSALGSEGRSAR